MKQDLGRPAAEAYTSEVAPVLHEIQVALRHVRRWAQPRRVHTPLLLFPASSWVYPEPYGSALIVGPFNYPVRLVLLPLIAALAAGNCVVLKPSDVAPHTSHLIAEMIGSEFDPGYLAVVEGGIEEAQVLLAQGFAYIFFTGSAHVGRLVMAAAAQHLTPVTLELGGKNPCIVEAGVSLDVAARRIVWGKFFNAGQTCVAPDFVLAHDSIKPALLRHLATAIEAFYGSDPRASPDYGRIVNGRHFERLAALLRDGEIAIGGQMDATERYISPTVLHNVTWDHASMQEEIFGPILPVLTFHDFAALLDVLAVRPKPLALYCFSDRREQHDELIRRLSAGAVCINDTWAQILNLRLPFGGVGASGMGAYHGRAGFETFSHRMSVVRRGTWIDPGEKYPPFRMRLGALRALMRLIQ